MEPKKRRRIPYGMTNFESIRTEDCYYVDKTHYIPLIEEANKFFFFIRPRRFGKTLLLNMLTHYYDINRADKFEQLFGGLWIGQHPTKEHNQYLVLFLNFSMISGDINSYQERMDNYCASCYRSFCAKYAHLLPADIMEEYPRQQNAAAELEYIARRCAEVGQKLYLIIDEYDHFTNDILAHPELELQYKGETHGVGAYRVFFNAVKSGTSTGIERMFVTGVSPVTMDDLTSGFNIGSNYTTDSAFNAMMGFSETEVRQMIDYYQQSGVVRHTTDELIQIMKPWYDNYCFSLSCLGESTLFNSDMVLYFMSSYLWNNGQLPEHMIDSNIRTDYNKLRMLIRKDKNFEHDASVIQQIVEAGQIVAELKLSFPAEKVADTNNFVSLLYYFGMLTIVGKKRGGILLRIPNYTVREQLYGYLLESYSEAELSLDSYHDRDKEVNMAFDGEWRPYFEAIADALKRFSSHRDKLKGEAYVHGFTLAQTCQSRLYLPHSELDAGVDHGYADIYLEPLLGIYPDIEHSYIIELKYRRSTATDAQVEQARQEGIQQALRYSESELVKRTVGHTTLHRLVIVWRGMEMAVCEEIYV